MRKWPKWLITGTELLSPSVPRSPSLPTCTSKLLCFTEENDKEWGWDLPDPKAGLKALCGCPGNFGGRFKVLGLSQIQAPSHPHPIWSHGGRAHPDSGNRAWAGFTEGKGNECDLSSCCLYNLMYSKNWCVTWLYFLILSVPEGILTTGKAACRKVLVPLGPHNPMTILGYKSLWHVTLLTGASDKGREPPSTWRCAWSSDTAIKHTLWWSSYNLATGLLWKQNAWLMEASWMPRVLFSL